MYGVALLCALVVAGATARRLVRVGTARQQALNGGSNAPALNASK